MASLLFFGSTGLNTDFGTPGSGLGFYGASDFGFSVAVGEYQGRTYITNAAGTARGPECNNVKYATETSGILGQAGSGIPLTWIPNAQSTLNIRFTHSSVVKTQNAKLIIYNRNNTPAEQYPASGVITKVVEIRHTNAVQGPTGSGHATWTTFSPSTTGTILLCSPSPGSGGYSVSGDNTYDTRHDYYFAISASPTSIGAKREYGLFFSLEYL